MEYLKHDTYIWRFSKWLRKLGDGFSIGNSLFCTVMRRTCLPFNNLINPSNNSVQPSLRNTSNKQLRTELWSCLMANSRTLLMMSSSGLLDADAQLDLTNAPPQRPSSLCAAGQLAFTTQVSRPINPCWWSKVSASWCGWLLNFNSNPSDNMSRASSLSSKQADQIGLAVQSNFEFHESNLKNSRQDDTYFEWNRWAARWGIIDPTIIKELESGLDTSALITWLRNPWWDKSSTA